MRKLTYLGMGLALCMGAALFSGCEKKTLDESEPSQVDLSEDIKALEASMVYVEGGTFMMGATEEQLEEDWADKFALPVHEVMLDSFYIGKYEITQGQWKAVMGTTVAQQRERTAVNAMSALEEWPLYGVGDDYPMYYVTWDETQTFCAKLGQMTGKKFRLPTEAEWEYAARGGQKADGTKYSGSDDLDEVAWVPENRDDITLHPVGQKKPNSLGLYDMSGGVMEWCSDLLGENYYNESPSVDPQGPTNGSVHVKRGGHLYYGSRWCSVSARFPYPNDYECAHIGFRVVCSL